jgi:hypothetical protein
MKEKLTAVEWLIKQIIKEKGLVDLDIQAAKEMEKEQNEKYNELKEVIEDMIKHLDEGIVLTLRKDSILVEALRNSINQ